MTTHIGKTHQENKSRKSPTYLSDMRPKFEPFEIDCGKIPAYRYKGNLKQELAAKKITKAEAVNLLEDMLMIREMEEMIVKLRSGAYEPIRDFNYRGPTHVSVGQEGTAAGACSVLHIADKITSTHRGHGESLAKGTVAIREMTDEQLSPARAALQIEQARGIAGSRASTACLSHDLRIVRQGRRLLQGSRRLDAHRRFYCRSSWCERDRRRRRADCHGCGDRFALSEKGRGGLLFAGDGAYANGVVLESMNFATQAQFTNHLADRKFGIPMIFLITNNHYGMTHRTDDEVMGVSRIARRAAGFADNNMHAEIVNGMDPLAVRDAVTRAAETLPQGRRPGAARLRHLPLLGPLLERPAQ